VLRQAIPSAAPARRDDDLRDVLRERAARLRRQPSVGHDDMCLVESSDATQSAHPPLRVIGDDDDTFGRGEVRLVGLALEQVGRREAGIDGHAVHAHEEHVDVQ
jgi:hypothetical protein